MCPLTIHEELVLMLSFWQIQDGYEVIVAARKKEAEAFSWVGCPLSLQNQPQNKMKPFYVKTSHSAAGE